MAASYAFFLAFYCLTAAAFWAAGAVCGMRLFTQTAASTLGALLLGWGCTLVSAAFALASLVSSRRAPPALRSHATTCPRHRVPIPLRAHTTTCPHHCVPAPLRAHVPAPLRAHVPTPLRLDVPTSLRTHVNTLLRVHFTQSAVSLRYGRCVYISTLLRPSCNCVFTSPRLHVFTS